MIAGVLTSLAELELELGRQRRAAAREARRGCFCHAHVRCALRSLAGLDPSPHISGRSQFRRTLLCSNSNVSTACERVLAESCGDSGSYLKNAHRDNRGVDMLIVAGRLVVAPDGRQTYLASCVDVVEQARSAAGCLDFMISADLVDPARINIFERWEWQAAVEAFRGRRERQRECFKTRR